MIAITCEDCIREESDFSTCLEGMTMYVDFLEREVGKLQSTRLGMIRGTPSLNASQRQSNTSHHQHSRCTWPRTLYGDIETDWRGRICVQHMVCIFGLSGSGVRFV